MVTFGSHVGNHQFQPFLSGVYAGVILVLSCLALPWLALAWLGLAWLGLSCLVLSCLVLSCLVLSCLVLSCPSVCLSVCLPAWLAGWLAVCLFVSLKTQQFYETSTWQHQKRSNSARFPQFLNLTTSKTKQFCETSFKNGKLSAEPTASCQCVLQFFQSMSLQCCACHEKVKPYEVLHLSRKIIFPYLKISCSKMQPLSGNQRPTFSRARIFFLLSFFFDLLSSSLLFPDSSRLCFSSVHIVGSLTSKLPSVRFG